MKPHREQEADRLRSGHFCLQLTIARAHYRLDPTSLVSAEVRLHLLLRPVPAGNSIGIVEVWRGARRAAGTIGGGTAVAVDSAWRRIPRGRLAYPP